MNAYQMVLGIIIVVTIGSIIRAKISAGRARRGRDFRPRGDDATQAENAQLREDLRAMKDRIAVLERLATDDDTSGARLDREIEKLRDPR